MSFVEAAVTAGIDRMIEVKGYIFERGAPLVDILSSGNVLEILVVDIPFAIT